MKKQTQLEPVLVRRNVFAKMAGVVASTVTKAVNSGELVPGPGGLLDVTDPVNAVFIEEHRDPFTNPAEKLLDPKSTVKLIFSIKKRGGKLLPVLGITYEPNRDTPTNPVCFLEDAKIAKSMKIIFGEKGPWGFELGGKFHQAHVNIF